MTPKQKVVLFTVVATVFAFLCEVQPSLANNCPTERAVFGNSKTDFELTFPAKERQVTEHPARLYSPSSGLEFVGEVLWSNGAARPYISLSMVDREVQYNSEVYGLGVNSKGNVINEGFHSPSYPANETILLPNLSATLYNQLKPDSVKLQLPDDVFHFSRCK